MERLNIDWRAMAQGTGLVGVAALASLLVDPQGWLLTREGAIECGIHLVLLGSLVALPAVSDYLRRLVPAHRLFLGAAVGLLLFGQYLSEPSEGTFPLVRWRMFPGPATGFHPFTVFELVGTTRDGQKVPLNGPQLFPSLKNYRMLIGINNLMEGMESPSGGEVQNRARRTTTGVLRAVGLAHNRQFPANEVESVSLVRRRMDPTDGLRVRRTGEEVLWTAALQGAAP